MKYLFRISLPIITMFFIACAKTPTERGIEWANGLVWYQIFPERFYNADSTNDPVPEYVPGAANEPGWRPHPWTSDWYALKPWEAKYSENFYDVVFNRRYGGDLSGVIQRLDYLNNLGVDALYFNPVFESPSLHKYDASTYHHIDNNFGPDPAGDRQKIVSAHETEDPDTWVWTSADSMFLELINQAHLRGMKVIIDGVFNHTGDTFFAMESLKANGKNSRYANWYNITSWDDPATPENELDYEGWWGYKTLPVLAEDDNGILPQPKKYIFDITRRWMDPNQDGNPSDGIDGWRLDVMEEVAEPFWSDWYSHVKSLNASAITVAEIWSDASEWIDEDRVDGTMNYLFARATKRFFIDKDSSSTSAELSERVDYIINAYGYKTVLRLWNLMDSHDTDRLGSMIVNPDRNYDRDNSPRWNPKYKVRKPLPFERQVQKQIVAFQLTFPGAPMIYYGDEVGMWGADDPDDRKPMVWPEMTFRAETHHPLTGKSRPRDYNYFDHGLFAFYQRMIALRHDHPALRVGTFTDLKLGEKFSGVYGFIREDENEQVICLFNRGNRAQHVQLSSGQMRTETYRSVFDDRNSSVSETMLEINAPANWFVVLISE